MSTELARRAVACEYWRPLKGMQMLPFDDSRSESWRAARMVAVADVDGAPFTRCVYEGCLEVQCLHDRALPDFDDPATLGCLLALVREAWGNPYFRCVPVFAEDGVVRQWMTCSKHRERICAGRSEAEALVAALEAAP